MSELQDKITIQGGVISGELKYVTGYTDAFPGEGDGNFLALSFESEGADKIETKITPGKLNTYVNATNDKFCVYRVTATTQKIEVRAEKGGKTNTKTYSLTGLTLKGAGG